VKRILIVNVNWLGDVLFSTPLIRAVRQRFPDAHIGCMVVPRCKDILESNPRLNEIIIYDEDGRHKGLLGKLSLISSLRSKKFDTAILLHRSFTRACMVFLAGISRRIGYHMPKRSFLLTENVNLPDRETHRVDFFLNLGKSLEISSADKNYEFFISDEHRQNIKRVFGKEGIGDKDTVIVINAGGNWEPKRWPKENFAKLADELAKGFGARIVITGAKKDLGLAEYIASLMRKRPYISCGRTSLKELAAIFERADLVISNDSGPMHIAVSMGAKTIALFGPTSPQITGPIGKGPFIILQKDVGCEIPCYDLSCGDYKCMEAITVADVLEAVKGILKR
jgi:heptosyltransferase II